VSHKDKKDFTKDMAKIYKACNLKAAESALEKFQEKW